MIDWEKALVSPRTQIIEVIRILDETATQICLVVDEERHLLGTVTDGDIRRGILASRSLKDTVDTVMNRRPKVAATARSTEEYLHEMSAAYVQQLPIVDEANRVTGLKTLQSLVSETEGRPNWVVLMAGGQGNRLRPLTETTPKPLLTVGDKPVLEIILDNCIKYGFRKFILSVFYKAAMVEKHFGDGSRWGVEIRYLEEDTPLGTAGSLRQIDPPPDEPLLVVNGDLLTNVNLDQLMDYHGEHSAAATMGVREYDIEVPFGVVDIEGSQVIGIEEKPVHRFFVNAGIYVLDSSVLGLIPAQNQIDMPDLFKTIIDRGLRTAAFPIREYWLDIGHIGDYERANKDAPGVIDK